MLDVQGRVDVDAGADQLLRVLPALRMPALGRVRMGQLVEQDDARTARERCVEIELLERLTAIGILRRGSVSIP